MEHSKDFFKIKKWYDDGIYTKSMVKMMQKKVRITEDEYIEIVGKE